MILFKNICNISVSNSRRSSVVTKKTTISTIENSSSSSEAKPANPFEENKQETDAQNVSKYIDENNKPLTRFDRIVSDLKKIKLLQNFFFLFILSTLIFICIVVLMNLFYNVMGKRFFI